MRQATRTSSRRELFSLLLADQKLVISFVVCLNNAFRLVGVLFLG